MSFISILKTFFFHCIVCLVFFFSNTTNFCILSRFHTNRKNDHYLLSDWLVLLASPPRRTGWGGVIREVGAGEGEGEGTRAGI